MKTHRNLKLFGLFGCRKVKIIFFRKHLPEKNNFLGRNVTENPEKTLKK
jgi:hypothetical protein